jgi:hypothetical protein
MGRMEAYLIRRIEDKLRQGLGRADIIEQLQALDTRAGIENLLEHVMNPIFKIVAVK